MKMRIATFAMTVCLALLATTALAQTVTYDCDRAANFSRYWTYAWTRGTEVTDELNHARIVRAIDAVLMAKGFAKVDASFNPNVLVAYHASFDESLEIAGSTQEPLGVGGDRCGSATVHPVPVGTLVVDIFDAGTGALVWRSLATSDVRPSDKLTRREKKIAKATKKMFQNYPPKP